MKDFTDQSDYSICKNHREYYGEGFEVALKQKKCLFKYHVNKKISKFKNAELLPYVISIDISDFLLKKHGILLPYQARTCRTCKRNIDTMKQQHNEEKGEESDNETSTSVKKFYEEPQSSESLYSNSQPTGSQHSWKPDEDSPSAPLLDDSDMKEEEFKSNPRQQIFELIRSFDTEFQWRQLAYKTRRPFPQLGRNAHHRYGRAMIDTILPWLECPS